MLACANATWNKSYTLSEKILSLVEMIFVTGIPRNKDNKDLNQLISVITAVFCLNSTRLQIWKHYTSYTIDLGAVAYGASCITLSLH